MGTLKIGESEREGRGAREDRTIGGLEEPLEANHHTRRRYVQCGCARRGMEEASRMWAVPVVRSCRRHRAPSMHERGTRCHTTRDLATTSTRAERKCGSKEGRGGK
jgi:hypothetical protein